MPINLILQNHSARNPEIQNSIVKNHKPENKTTFTLQTDDYKYQGEYLRQLSLAQNATTKPYFSVKDNSGTAWKGTILAILAQLTPPIGRTSLFGARTITNSLPPGTLLGPGITPLSLSLSPFTSGMLNSIYQLTTSFKDPLHFPAAEGAYIPTAYATSQQNRDIHTKLYALRMFENNIEDEGNLSIESLNEQQNTDINNVVFVIDSVLAATKNNDYETTKLKTITDMLLGDNKSLRKRNLGGIRKLPIIDDWIERQIFGDKLYKYLRAQILKNRHQGLDLLPKLVQGIDEKLRATFDDFSAKKSEAMIKYVRGNIVNIEFPACSYEFHQSFLDPFQWGLCHAGYYFLNKLMVDVAKLTRYEVYARGYDLYHQFRAGSGDEEWVRLFSLPAMIHYILTAPQNDIDALVDNPQWFHETALNAYFNYLPGKASGENPIAKLHTSVRQFIEFFSSPDKTNSSDEHDLVYDKLLVNLSSSYQGADEVYINAAFSSLPRADYDFIHKAIIHSGTFALGLSEERNGDEADTQFDIRHMFNTLFRNPCYLKIFLCKSGDEHRIYALQSLPSGYVVKRVDSDASLYRELLTNEDKIKFNKNTILSKRFKDEAISSEWDGIKNLAKYFAADNARSVNTLLAEIDWQNDELQDVIDNLHSLKQVAFRQCFDNSNNDAANPASLTCSFHYFAQNLIPFFIRSTTSYTDAHNEFDRLKATSGRDLQSGFAMALAAQQALEQAPDDGKSSNRYPADLSPEGQQLNLKEMISQGMASLGENEPQDYFFSLNNYGVYRTLKLGQYTDHVINKRGQSLSKLHRLTQHAYQSMPQRFYEILSPEDHVGRSQGNTDWT